MSRPLSVIRGLVMLSMVLALMSAFTVNVGAQAAGDVQVINSDGTASCFVTAAEFDDLGLVGATLEDGDQVTATAMDVGGVDVAAGGPITYDSTMLNTITLAPLAGTPAAAGDTVTIEATGADGTVTATCTLVAADPGPGAGTAGPTTISATAADGTVLTCTVAADDFTPVQPDDGDTLTATLVDADDGSTLGTGTGTASADGTTITIDSLTGDPAAGDTVNVTFTALDGTVGTATCTLAGAAVPTVVPTVAPTVVPGTGDITITKTDQSGATLPGAEFTASAADGTNLGSATTDAAGVAVISTGAVVGDVVTLTESIVPDGCTADTPTQDVTINEGGNAVAVTNDCAAVGEPTATPPVEDEANAFVDVEKLVCTETADDPAGDVDIFVPGEFVESAEAPAECRAAVADEFSFTLNNNDLAYSGGEIVAIDTAATGESGQAILGAFVDETIGTRTVFVTEDLTGAESVDIVLTPGDTAELLIINYVAAVVDETPAPGTTGDVEIAKLYCTDADLAGQVEFEVLGPETPVEATGVTAQAANVEADNCTPGAAEFEIFAFGDKTSEPILVTVGSDGLIVIDDVIPVTTDLSPHKLKEVSTGAEAQFDVADGAVTKLIVINYIGADTGDDGKDDGGDTGDDSGDTGDDKKDDGGDTGDEKDDSGDTGGDTSGDGKATTLPDTGAGTGQSGADYGAALFLVLGGLAAAGISLRRRAA